jgi:hypothetical protein
LGFSVWVVVLAQFTKATNINSAKKYFIEFILNI